MNSKLYWLSLWDPKKKDGFRGLVLAPGVDAPDAFSRSQHLLASYEVSVVTKTSGLTSALQDYVGRILSDEAELNALDDLIVRLSLN